MTHGPTEENRPADEAHGGGAAKPPFFHINGGTLPLDARSYLARQADEDLFQAL